MPLRGRAAVPVGTALIIGLLGQLAGVARRRPRTIWDRRDEPPGLPAQNGPASRPGFLSRWRIMVGVVAIAIIGVGVAAAYRLRDIEKHREAAIALTGGDPDRGRAAMERYGCAGCHTIPGVPGARGLVGPPLADIGRRVYVGGVVPNTPDNLINWIVDPRSIDPKTAMPVTGISRLEARDVAAYLYALP